MTAARYRAIRELFGEARALPVDKREAFVASRADNDPAIAEEVRNLLADEDREASRLPPPGQMTNGARDSHDDLSRAIRSSANAQPDTAHFDSPLLDAARWRSAVEPPAASSASPAPVVAGFRIIRTLGEGGMGVVYEAEQQRPPAPGRAEAHPPTAGYAMAASAARARIRAACAAGTSGHREGVCRGDL